MNKSELIDAIASAANLSKADAGRALNATTGAITSALSGGDGVQITGLVVLWSELVQRAQVVTLKRAQRFKLKHLKMRHLKPVKL